MREGALVLVLLVAALWWHRDGVERGRIEGRAEAARLRTPALAETVRVADVRYQRDTVRLRTVLTRWDSVRVTDTLTRLERDTLVVYVPRAEADSAIAQCLVTVRSCERGLAARDTLIGALRVQVRALEASRPGVWEVWVPRVLLLAGGYWLGSRGR